MNISCNWLTPQFVEIRDALRSGGGDATKLRICPGELRMLVDELRVDVRDFRVGVDEIRVGVREIRVDVGRKRVDVREIRVGVGRKRVGVREIRVGVGRKRVEEYKLRVEEYKRCSGKNDLGAGVAAKRLGQTVQRGNKLSRPAVSNRDAGGGGRFNAKPPGCEEA